MKKQTTASSSSKKRGILLPRSKITIAPDEIIADYRLAFSSRAASLLGRKEVLTGKAKFGIFGDGKELPQIAMAKAFKKGDFRAGYYRDQTFMLAAGLTTLDQFFAQLYADPDPEREPASAGRMMNSHFGTRLTDTSGSFVDQTATKNSSSDISPTAGQMARVLGLAYASKLYRNEPALKKAQMGFSEKGNEIAFGTIGDASTSEGVFFEAMNAAGVLQVPLLMSVWDDGYGISVPREHQTNRGSISLALAGFASDKAGEGFLIEKVKAWDYPEIVDAYQSVSFQVRRMHKPALMHVVDVTQPQGHSTSGSHERYKSKERLQWESEYCCLAQMRKWMIAEKIATAKTLDELEAECQKEVNAARARAWEAYQKPIKEELDQAVSVLHGLSEGVSSARAALVSDLASGLKKARAGTTYRRQVQAALHKAQLLCAQEPPEARAALDDLLVTMRETNHRRFNSHLHSESTESPLQLRAVAPTYSNAADQSEDGRKVLLKCFEHHFETNPRFFALGEDVGKMGDVNLVFEGLNAKFGDLRVSDTGIREATILGQGIGAALRGLRPLVDIQYLDYLIYALQVMSDDLATTHYRTAGAQKCPVIIRTKGHRLEGIWHTGSPIAMILGAVRGLYVCVPRNMTQAAGMYNVLLRSDNPALVIEVLNGYRLKEAIPDNVGTFQVPLGVPEILREGSDITVVTYGACCRVAQEAAAFASENMGISLEIIDVQTLLPFDRYEIIKTSLQKTNAVIFFDEDVPGGATAYMMQEVLEKQRAFEWLDLRPRTLSAQPNRAAYASDGDYYCKPNAEDLLELCYQMMREQDPGSFPELKRPLESTKGCGF